MRLAPLCVSDADRAVLESRVAAATTPRRDWQRATIVLMAADGASNRDVAVAVGLNEDQVSVWRKRFASGGLAALVDGKRRGRPPVYDGHDRLKIVKTITETPPGTASRWTMDAVARRLADDVGISASQVWRICVGLELKPWQVRSWMTSHDRDFWVKAADVCGLYLNPPANTVVYSVDEKTGMQAKSRKNATKPAVPGIPARQEFEYVRHGTRVLFAGLNVLEGNVEEWVTDSTRSENFVHFLARLDAVTPAHMEMHCVVDNLSAHGTKAVEEFLDSHQRVFIHNTPTHASWLNQVEMFFSIIGRRLLKHGEFDSVEQLAMRITDFIENHNHTAQPFEWRYDGHPKEKVA